MEKAISWLEENEDWHKSLLICDCKTLVDAVGNSHALDKGMRLVQVAVAWLKAERCLEILWVTGHCSLMGNQLADEEAKSDLAEHQTSVAQDSATRRPLIRRACALTLKTTALHAATYPRSPLQQEDVLLSKCGTTELRRFRSGNHPAIRRWKSLINRSEETMCHVCDNVEESHDHLWLRCPAIDEDRQRLDLGVYLAELVRLQARAQVLLRIILRCLR